jgi:hypothetical protein
MPENRPLTMPLRPAPTGAGVPTPARAEQAGVPMRDEALARSATAQPAGR